jgi:hypothetical protein
MSTNALESKNYVAAPEDIIAITRESLDATERSQEVRGTYLRALIGTTQNELGLAMGKRKRIQAPMTEEETKRQLEAMERVHERFYKSVLDVVTKHPIREEETGMKREVLYSRRANFARSSKSTLRAWLLSANDIRTLTASKVTKYALTAEIVERRGPQQARAPSEKFLTRFATRIIDRVKKAQSTEQQVRLLEVVIQQLVSGLLDMGVQTTTNLEEALRDHKLLQTQTGIVWAGRNEPLKKAA